MGLCVQALDIHTMESFPFLPSSETSCIDASLSPPARGRGAMLGAGTEVLVRALTRLKSDIEVVDASL